MNKINTWLLAAVAVLLLTGNLYPRQEPLFEGLIKGQYIYYHDTRRGGNRITGLLKYFDGTIVCRTYDVRTGKDTVVALEVRQANNAVEIVPVRHYTKGRESDNLKNDLQYVLVDFMNIARQYRQAGRPDISRDTLKTDKWPEFGYILEHRFAAWVPFFRLYSSRRTDLKEPFYTVALMSRLTDRKDDAFLALKEIPLGVKQQSFKIEKSTAYPVELEHLKFNLDGNWKNMGPRPDIGLPHVTYWIAKNTRRDAQIGVEKLVFPGKPIALEKLACLMVQVNQNLVVPSSLKFDVTGTYIRAGFVTLDRTSRVENYFIQTIYAVSGNEYNILNFSTYKSVYDDNKKYFDAILNNAVLKK